MGFACPPDCGYCCTHLHRDVPEDEAAATQAFRDILRDQGVYHCGDAVTTGLSLSNAEAARFRELGADVHPRTFLIETRRRLVVTLDWHMARAVCPFYQSYQCTVYEDRPLVCRAYPVMQIGRSATKLAPECPKMPVPTSQLLAERKVRRAIDEAHVKLDETALAALARGSFATGLTASEAAARAERYRAVPVEAFVSAPPPI
jgi:Fe-S-cluster containining protein